MSTYDWEQQFPATSSNQWASQMAYDVARNKVVLFGNYVGPGVYDYDDTTWTWDGTNWTQEAPATSPPFRVNGRMVWDDVNQGVLLFGGQTSSVTFKSDTWLWDGTNWTDMSPVTTPAGRFNQGLARDPNNNVVMFGGFGTVGPYKSDTYLWDGTDWSLQSPGSVPDPRSAMVMVGDFTNNNVLLYSGDHTSTPDLSDTWLWDGSDWTQQFPSTDPGPRQSGWGAFVTELGVLMHGGFHAAPPNPAGNYIDTWLWDGTDWTEQFPDTVPAVNFPAGLAEWPSEGWIFMFTEDSITNDPESWYYKPNTPQARVLVRMWGWRTEIDDNSNETTTVMVSPESVIGS